MLFLFSFFLFKDDFSVLSKEDSQNEIPAYFRHRINLIYGLESATEVIM